jgi:hypothetical protein
MVLLIQQCNHKNHKIYNHMMLDLLNKMILLWADCMDMLYLLVYCLFCIYFVLGLMIVLYWGEFKKRKLEENRWRNKNNKKIWKKINKVMKILEINKLIKRKIIKGSEIGIQRYILFDYLLKFVLSKK